MASGSIESSGLRMAIAGGGTGGHVVPGLHLLAHAAQRGLATDVLWFGAGRAVEERVFQSAEVCPSSALTRVTLDLEPAGGGAPSRARLMARIGPTVLRARRALADHGSQVLLGLGGYTVVPAVLAARSLGIPICLLEINAHAGLATRWLGRFATRVVHAWPSTAPTPSSSAGRERHLVLGPPLAPEFLSPDATAEERRILRGSLGFDPERPLLVVLGGSQGARGLNRFCAAFAERLLAGGAQILHQVGPGRLHEAASPGGQGYRPVEFVDGMRGVLDAADLVLCRGGASTLAEVAARGVPALVVPYPHHKDGHQEHNAEVVGDGLVVVHEEELGERICTQILDLLARGGASERRRRGELLRRAVPRDAASRLLDELCVLARPPGPGGPG